jgi:rsbT co-antagonist protein RsbR
MEWMEEESSMASVDSGDDIASLRRRIEELEHSEVRYRNLFENSPISLWEEDWTDICTHVNQITASGVTDLDSHFTSHFDEVIACARMVKVIDVNRSTLQLCRATSKEQLLAGLSVIFNETTMQTFQRELVVLGQGATFYEEESAICTLDSSRVDVVFRIAISTGCERTWERCFISLVDITDRKRAEEALCRSREETILAQRSALAKLSTPVIPINDRIIVMPLVGALDMARMQRVMGSLLEEIQKGQVSIAILDITGVPEIDVEAASGILLVAQATRLLGAQVVLTGIQPQVARGLIEIGADMTAIVTRGTLQAGIAYAMRCDGTRRG